MLRVFRSLHGLAFLLVSCVALAQPSSSPTPGPADTPLATATPPAPALAPTGGTAPPLQACATKAFDDYASAMSVWERQWAEGVIAARPDFNTAAIARASAHNSALQRDGFRIHYLAANAPDDLNLDESIAAMRLFDWTPEQEQALRLTVPDYASAVDAADRDRLAADAQPKAEELENYFEETFTESAGAVWARKLGEVLHHGNEALEQCHKLHPAPVPKAEGAVVEGAGSPAVPGNTPPAQPDTKVPAAPDAKAPVAPAAPDAKAPAAAPATSGAKVPAAPSANF